jgi:hypothetical protein
MTVEKRTQDKNKERNDLEKWQESPGPLTVRLRTSTAPTNIRDKDHNVDLEDDHGHGIGQANRIAQEAPEVGDPPPHEWSAQEDRDSKK